MFFGEANDNDRANHTFPTVHMSSARVAQPHDNEWPIIHCTFFSKQFRRFSKLLYVGTLPRAH